MADKLVEGEGALRPGTVSPFTGDESFSPYAVQPADVLRPDNALTRVRRFAWPFG